MRLSIVHLFDRDYILRFRFEIRELLICIISVILMIISYNTSEAAQIRTDYYEKGLEELKADNWFKAVNTWRQGFVMLAANGMSDPRIGIAFIETVTEREMKHFYETANDIYLWGFKHCNFKDHRETLEQEVERLLPLIPKDDRKAWKEDLKKKNPEIINKIRWFWLSKDPTPASKYNERLIEHWERIACARKTYRLNTRSPYMTDDRGTIFVKFGEPIWSTRGSIGRIDPPIEIAKGIKNNPEAYREFELWKYWDAETSDRVIYLFGEVPGKGFGLVNGVEDFIDNRHFRASYKSTTSNGEGRLIAGTKFQLLYYNELAHYDNLFVERYNEIESQIIVDESRGSFSTRVYKSMNNKFEVYDKEDPVKIYGRQEISEYIKTIAPVNIVTTQTRYLDEENNRKLSILALSFPQSSPGLYHLTNMLHEYDQQGNELERREHVPEKQYDNTSAFVLDHKDDPNRLVVSSTVYPTDSAGMVFDARTANAGKVILDELEPLNTDMTKLEVSDMLTGIDFPEGFEIDEYPFPVLPTGRIDKGDPLQVYFEIYHLFLGREGKAQFTMEFQLKKLGEGGFINLIRGRGVDRDITSRKEDFESLSNRFVQKITFDVSDLDFGEYEIMVEVKDTNSGQKKTSRGKFRIIE